MSSKKKFYDENGECVACGFVGVDLHHIKTKGSGGSDESFNLMPLCHEHHVAVHSYGLVRFLEVDRRKSGVNAESVLSWLRDNGWCYDVSCGKFIHDIEFRKIMNSERNFKNEN